MKNIDPLFIGLTVDSGYQIASKSIFKQKPLDKVAVYCKKSGKPSILDYDDIDIKLSVSKSKDGMYQYREANILSHLMNLEAIKKVSNIHLPYHRAYKKNAFVNEEGMKQIPDKPNSFKFENFIFDSFAFFDDMLLLRVDENDEFAPIKDFTGIYNPDTAKEKYEKELKEKEEELKQHFTGSFVDQAKAFDQYLSVVPEAMVAVAHGVTAMHDVTEGGIYGALWELAEASGVGLEIDLKAIPIRQETVEVCEQFHLNPYQLISSGSMLMAAPDGLGLVQALKKAGIPASIVGRCVEGKAKKIVNGEDTAYLERPKTDELYKIYE